jgi:hypothetical protein
MNIAHNLLDDLTGIGATIEPAGRPPYSESRADGNLRWLAGSAGPSASLWQRLWPERILAPSERMTTVGAKRR